MSTDLLSKMTSLSELTSFAQEKGLDLNQAPVVENDETGRRRMRRWIRDMLASQPGTIVTEEPVLVVTPEEIETPQPEIEHVVVTPEEPTKRSIWSWLRWVLLVIVVVGIIIWAVSCSKNATAPVEPTKMATSTAVPTKLVQPTVRPTVQPTDAPKPTATAAEASRATEVSETTPVVASASDGKALAESILSETLPWPVPAYTAGKPGFPEVCSGLCWDKSKLDKGILVWYGPADGSEDITQSDVAFGDGTASPIELMRNGTVNTVIFANGLDAQMEVCAINGSTLDGKLIADWLKDSDIKEQCGRFALPAGWHVVKDNMNAPIAGFGVRLSANGWASMTEPQIIQYNKYWTIDGNTATWNGPEGVEIMLTPAMVSMMQDFGSLTEVVFTITSNGTVFFCNGTVTGTVDLSSPDGSCRIHEVLTGTYTYHGEQRTSAGISWQPAK